MKNTLINFNVSDKIGVLIFPDQVLMFCKILIIINGKIIS